MPKKDKKGALPTPPPVAAAAEQFDMVFHCQLAHGSPTKQVREFTNVKQLYEAIAKAFSINTAEILYCTLNCHRVDMTRLLGGQIGLDDFLFAHVKGESATVKVSKDGPALGLTISDNGAGYAFIKKIRDDSIMARVEGIQVGDHISAINGQDLTGCRHFEVAKMLKDIEIGSEFTISRVSPKKAFDGIDKRGDKPVVQTTIAAGAGKKTLRMKRDGTAVVEEVDDKKTQAINKIEDMLEEQVGIRDEELSTTIYDLALKSKECDELAEKIDSELSAFAFPDDFVMDVFEMLHS